MAPKSIEELRPKCKVYGAIQNIPRHHSHIRYTCQHVHFFQRSAETMPQTAICATTALLSPADSLESKHMHVQILPSTQHPAFKRGKYDPAIAQTAPWKMASKAALMPACGEDQQVADPKHQRESRRRSRPRPAAHRWWSSCQSIDDAAAHHQPLAATVELLAPTKAATEGEIRKS